MPWPNHCPDDFRKDIEALQLRRYSTGPAELWSVVKVWLERNGVEPVELPSNAATEKVNVGHKTPDRRP